MLVRRFLLELGEEETAAALGMRRGTVKSRTSRALERSAAARGGGAVSVEHELRALAAVVSWPDEPDVTATVRSRLEAAPQRDRRRRRRVLAIALAVVVAVVAATMAVPQARTAILHALGIGSVRVELVDDLPALRPRSDVALLGAPVPRDQAGRIFEWPLLRFDGDVLGEPDEIRARLAAHGLLPLAWAVRRAAACQSAPGTCSGGRFRQDGGAGRVGPQLTIDGRRALWITGDAHGFGLDGGDFEELRLSGNALLVDRGETTIRIEGDLSFGGGSAGLPGDRARSG